MTRQRGIDGEGERSTIGDGEEKSEEGESIELPLDLIEEPARVQETVKGRATVTARAEELEWESELAMAMAMALEAALVLVSVEEWDLLMVMGWEEVSEWGLGLGKELGKELG